MSNKCVWRISERSDSNEDRGYRNIVKIECLSNNNILRFKEKFILPENGARCSHCGK